jgi:hypothetical protein
VPSECPAGGRGRRECVRRCAYRRRVSVAHALTICGGLFEAGGIGLTVREVVRVEDRAFPERRGRLLRAWRRMRARLSGESRTIHVSGIDSAVAIGGSVSVRVDRGAAHPEDLKARIDRLEKLVDDRDREHRGAVERVEQRIVEVQRELGERVDELVAERSRKDTEDHEALADSLALQKAGAVLFIVGAFLSAAGGVVG